MSDQPLVSVIIPTRNRAELLERALNSVFEQTYGNLEIVVVDDASDDDTPALIKKLGKKHPIKDVRNNTAAGAAASRNIAVQIASGEFIAGLDDDDFWRPKRIEILLGEFTESYSAVCSYDRMVMGEKEFVWKKPGIITADDLLYYNQVGNQVLTRRKYILDVGGYDETLPSAQDYDLWIRLSQKFGPVKTAPQVLQVINMDDDRERITESDNQLKGYYKCFEKHKHLMSESHIKYQKYRLKMVEGESVGWVELFRSVPRKLYIKEITRKLFM